MKRSVVLLACAFVLTILADRITKYIALKNLDFQGFFLDSNFLKLGITPTINKFFSFGIKIPEFIGLALLIIVIVFLIIIFFKQTKKLSIEISLMLILIGAISNLMDRFMHHGVIDFLNIQIHTFQWPIFNISDILITIGVLLLIKDIYKDHACQ